MKQIKILIIVVVLILLLVGAYLLYHNLEKIVDLDQLSTQTDETVEHPSQTETEQQTESEEKYQETVAVPDVPLTDWDGNTVQLSDYFGKPIVLNFWASWCGPCKSEMPDFQKVYEELGEDVHFLMVNVTGGQETVDTAKNFINKLGYTFPVFFDVSGAAAYTYSTYSIPTSFFINQEGKLVTYAKGAISEELLRKGIDMITGQQ